MPADGYPEQIVAILHDTIEDTPLTLKMLAEDGFPSDILAALDALTQQYDEKYEAFIEQIALNPLTVRVKLLDLYDNIDVTRLPKLTEWDLNRTAKYHRAIRRLEQVPSDTLEFCRALLSTTYIVPDRTAGGTRWQCIHCQCTWPVRGGECHAPKCVIISAESKLKQAEPSHVLESDESK